MTRFVLINMKGFEVSV